jgi:uncharacterized protein (DUF1330 family)
MPKGYVILTEAIHDREGMDAYAAASRASLLAHDGRVLVVEEDVEVLEGEWHGTRTRDRGDVMIASGFVPRADQ